MGSGNIILALAPVAQLDRVSDYESEGREFESLPAHQQQRTEPVQQVRFFVFYQADKARAFSSAKEGPGLYACGGAKLLQLRPGGIG